MTKQTDNRDQVFSPDFPDLLAGHLDHLLASAISPDVIRERGYRSVLRAADQYLHHPEPGCAALGALGFKQTQMLLPAILMPLYGVDGKVVLHQLRPDNPRVDESNERHRPIKYETPAKRNMRLDIPPRCRPDIDDPMTPLFITEGVKKADALASAGACAVCLLGVYNWRGKNAKGGLTALPEWESIALNDRKVYICYDSDIVDKTEVKEALDRLTKFLAGKHAVVKIVHLPPGKGGAKTGVDDFLAQGHNLEDVIGLASVPEKAKERGPLFANQFDIRENLIFVNRYDRDGNELNPLPACNFAAKIVAVVIKDDGNKQTSFYNIIGRRENHELLKAVNLLPVEEFPSLSWVEANWKTKAIIDAHPNARAQVVQAIKINSQDAVEKSLFAHLGWRMIDGQWTYLTCGAAINAAGANGIAVELDDRTMRDYRLPPYEDPRDKDGTLRPLYREALAASYDFLRMGNLRVTLPLWAAMYMAPLNPIIDTNFTLFIQGLSGSYKSSITSLALNHFGEGWTYDHLPGNWSSTDNSLEYSLSICRDMPYLIDDFAPGSDYNEARLLQSKAKRIIQAQANRGGRNRMTRDITARARPEPQGFLITSGEHAPTGASQARIFTVRITDTDIKRERVRGVTKDRKRLYTYAMTQYIGWLARSWKELEETLPMKEAKWYSRAEKTARHAKLPAHVAKLYLGLSMGLQFMAANKTIGPREATRLADTGFEILASWASEQSERAEEMRPSQRFIDGLSGLMDQGKAVFRDKDDPEPYVPKPGQTAIGWVDEKAGFYYLSAHAAFALVREFWSHEGTPLTFAAEAVWRDLKERGWSLPNENRLDYNAYIGGTQRKVVRLKMSALGHGEGENSTGATK